MKRILILTTVALALAGCENMTPETQAIIAQGVVDIGKEYVSRDRDRSGKDTVPASPVPGP